MTEQHQDGITAAWNSMRARIAELERTNKALDNLLREASIERDELRAALERKRQTLIGISQMDDSDGERMKLWATDDLSGPVETTEETIFSLSEQRNELRAALGKIVEIDQLHDDAFRLRDRAIAIAAEALAGHPAGPSDTERLLERAMFALQYTSQHCGDVVAVREYAAQQYAAIAATKGRKQS